jgi:rhodanese-related sulfurtransferase
MFITRRSCLLDRHALNKNTRLLLVIGAVLIVAASAYWLMMPKEQDEDYGDVSVERAWELTQEKPSLVILDVRTDAEFSEGHIEGAINIPVGELEGRLGELDRDDEMLVYCRTGNRSRTAVGILEGNDFNKIYHMNNGITAWTSAGYPTVI